MMKKFSQAKTISTAARMLALAGLTLGLAAAQAHAAPRLIAVSGSNMFVMNPISGALQQTIPITGATGIVEMAHDCATGTTWVVTSGDNLYTIDLTTGVCSLVGSFSSTTILMHGMVYDQTTNSLYGVSSSNGGALYAMDKTNGAVSLISMWAAAPTTDTNFLSVGIDTRNNVMYAAAGIDDTLHTVDRITGAHTLVGPLEPGGTLNLNPHSLTYSKDSGVFYMMDTATNAAEGLYIVDQHTGVRHRLNISPAGATNPLAMCYIPDDCVDPTVPVGTGWCTPFSAMPNQQLVATAKIMGVAGGTPSTGIQVVGDFTAVGGPAAQVMTPGANNEFTYTVTLPSSIAPGSYIVPLTISDAQGRIGSGAMSVGVRPGPGPGFVGEVEPNESKATATPATITAGTGVYGLSTGSSTTTPGDASADTFLLTNSALPPAIYRHRLTITTLSPGATGHTGTIRGLNQSNSVIGTTDTAAQTSSTSTTPQRFNQWYGFGKQEQLYYRVTGAGTSPFEYFSTMETVAVTPIVASTNFQPGGMAIFRDASVTFNVDFLVYDSNFNALEDMSCEGTGGLARTFAAGTYYLGVADSNVADSRATSLDSTARNSNVLDFPNAVMNSSTTLRPTLAMTIMDNAGNSQTIACPKNGPYDVAWIKFTVGAPANQRCQPADIASDDGTPLPTDLNLHPNGGVNEGDYNSFFQGFFDAAANCDIANDDGSPRAPFGSDGTNGGVNEGDYNCFFQKFFDGCPA